MDQSDSRNNNIKRLELKPLVEKLGWQITKPVRDLLDTSYTAREEETQSAGAA